jgi:hypothetical protein
MSLRLPIGVSDFKQLIETDYYFVDKSLLIKDIIEDGAVIILIPRPRRFGKTLNLSMLHYFFNATSGENNSHLFQGLLIQEHPECMAKQNSIPSIFLSLKDTKAGSYETFLQLMQALMGELYDQYRSLLLESDKLSDQDKIYFKNILSRQGNESDIANALKMLTKFLYAVYGNRVMVFLDEYDAPIHTAYANEHYDQLIIFMRTFMGGAFQDNIYLEKGVITGILRIAQASIFSDLNNIDTYSLLRRMYAEYFGFTQNEVDTLLAVAHLERHGEDIKQWYNGYQVKELKLYNPWSIVNCVKRAGSLEHYWLGTSANTLIKNLLSHANLEVKKVFESLLQGEAIVKSVKENIVLPELPRSEEAIWSLLLFSGYLTTTECKVSDYGLSCELRIPNREVGLVYHEMIREWFSVSLSLGSYDQLLQSLITGNWDAFAHILQDYIRVSGSYFDFNANTSEAVYHAFILGIVSGLRDHYIILSNREAGYGRCDLAMIPKDPLKHKAMILEFKRRSTFRTLRQTARIALDQIAEKDYTALLAQHPIKNVTAVGIAFAEKNVAVTTREIVIPLVEDAGF